MPDSNASPTPQEKLNTLLNSIEYSLSSLQSDVQFASLRDGLEDLDTQIHGLPGCIKELRSHGYVYGKGLDANAQDLKRRWTPVRANVQSEIIRQTPRMQAELSPLETQFSQV